MKMAYIFEWFKIIQDEKFLGVITDQNFARYSEAGRRMHVCQAKSGQYATLNGKYYRDSWMLPVHPEAPVEAEEAQVVAISQKEYDTLVKNEPVRQERRTVEITRQPAEKRLDGNDIATLEYVRERKLYELSLACTKTIEDGFSLVLADGAPRHFSLTEKDQLNLLEMRLALACGEDIYYHADGELTQLLSPEDARDILSCAKRWKDYHMMLFNSMKNWVMNLTDMDEIEKVTFDSEIPEEYCSAALQTMAENF